MRVKRTGESSRTVTGSAEGGSTSLPTVDEQLDEMPWRWDTLESPDSDLPPQPCMFSTAFVETAKLSLIMQRIMTTLYVAAAHSD
jgi:anti-sigma factor ChrR (cupin superfamily)